MKNKKGPIILFVLIVLIAVIAYFGKGILFDKKQKNTSDAETTVSNMTWAGDSYLGYGFLHTVELKKQLARKGISLKFYDDGGDYTNRLENFANKKYDFIVLPINSYLEHGAEYKYPGVIVAAICESVGADAIVGFSDLMPTGKINDLNNSDINFYYTSKSPSSFLLDLTISDFDLDELKKDNSWRHETASSEEVYKMAAKAAKEGNINDAFVMWEPDVTKAVNKLNMKKLWGSDKFRGYIIDVFVFHRDVVASDPEKVMNFIKTYFRVLNYYAQRKDEMIDEMSKIAKIDEDIVTEMTESIDWYNLQENCSQLFDIPIAVGLPSTDGLINSIYACSDVLQRSGTISEGIDDPYAILNSSFLEELKNSQLKAIGNKSGSNKFTFNELTTEEWNNLAEIGVMRVKPITFQSGTNSLEYQGEEIVDKVAKMLETNYPAYRVLIKGHTGRGDQQANLELSEKRAQMVRQRLIGVHGIDANRLFAKGMGAKSPPKKKPGENQRAYSLRWARVEFVLLEDTSF